MCLSLALKRMERIEFVNKKKSDTKQLLTRIFCSAFIIMLILPLIFINLKPGEISIAENRRLAPMPVLYKSDGQKNDSFISDLEVWVDDNIGFRSLLVLMNADLQFYFFKGLENNGDYYLGPHGELNYASAEMLKDYCHVNLRSEDELEELASAYETVNSYLEELGAQFFYMQCWDKHSIYPEYFPQTVHQYGKISRTDQMIETLQQKTVVKIISPKEELVNLKDTYDTYSVWGDPTHWSQRGAYIGYLQVMRAINAKNDGKYKVLKEEDFEITWTDQGKILFGGIHKEDFQEDFQIKRPEAHQTDEEPLYQSPWQSVSRHVYVNDSVKNNDTLLVIGDSYIDSFIIEDFAESFHKTVMVWGENMVNIIELIDYYRPTIVLNENAERCDRSVSVLQAAERIRSLDVSSLIAAYQADS